MEPYCHNWNEDGTELVTNHLRQTYRYFWEGNDLGVHCEVCEWELFDGTKGVYWETTRIPVTLNPMAY
jgi:hypothetical protein